MTTVPAGPTPLTADRPSYVGLPLASPSPLRGWRPLRWLPGTSCVEALTVAVSALVVEILIDADLSEAPVYFSVNPVAPGALVNITSNADFPVHVQHAGADIALGAGGGPLPPGIPPGWWASNTSAHASG